MVEVDRDCMLDRPSARAAECFVACMQPDFQTCFSRPSEMKFGAVSVKWVLHAGPQNADRRANLPLLDKTARQARHMQERCQDVDRLTETAHRIIINRDVNSLGPDPGTMVAAIVL